MGSASTAKGLVPPTNAWPVPGSSAQPGSPTTTPTMLTQTTTDQPRPSRRPVGNSSRTSTRPGAEANQAEAPTHSANVPAGQPSVAARSPQPWARSEVTAFATPRPHSSQPIGWRRCRLRISRPVAASTKENTA
ncbi:hypothetical protein [Nocardioides ungokensis]|uniref:hypothetical protein n=1 Tax=Nocardioides ungokensis TaxID=1643322 RepID=UPI0015DF8668|nr:hypothetical protein [Nocardioides ungokensis]